MDYEARISRAEARLEMNQRDIERLYQALSELRSLILGKFEQVELRFAEERKHIDLRFSEELKHIDLRFGEAQRNTDASISEVQSQLREMRHEASVNMRWMLGMWLTTIGMVVGLGGRVLGMY